MPLTIFTWNVLHRVHAENYAEGILAGHPDEATRIAAIADRVVGWDGDVACLQEVSGDQLAALRARIGDRWAIFAAPYPRLPKFRFATTTRLADAAEYLVTIAPHGATAHAAAAFESDRGKGYLAVIVDDVLVVNTHVSFAERAPAQLAIVHRMIAAADRPTVLVGDFNAPREVVLADLPGMLGLVPPAGSLPTRPRPDPTSASSKSHVIDHAFVRGLSGRVAVVSCDLLSDHNIVRAEIDRPDATRD